MQEKTQIYAKDQQLIIVDNILNNLCPSELSNDGRKYLNKLKAKIKEEKLKLQSRLTDGLTLLR